ncbi:MULTISPECIES: LysE family transporter [unclassified Spirosoma]|uniref:LysE family translocator n=1 Tax=unclassified Spirosoma TaxID=2621999 RepID=UPI000962500D|nr:MULTISPECIES: LysE family transporter [unclassified Spirosoma]MBN8826872.1 LysE family transporter [Spirosoma sp.]OJW75551.1 MAG: hypothetical protein BGO59_08415 [Spirosoma sp. 48-14]
MFTLFLLVAVISFVGSLHPGTVNLAVIETTLGQSRRAGLWLALGGSLPEMAYSILAAGGLMLLPMSPQLGQAIELTSIPVLLLAGIATFRQKAVPVRLKTEVGHATVSRFVPFWKGMALAGTNPQLLPFWSAVWLYLNQSMVVPADRSGAEWVFAAGTSAGAFVLLLSLVWLADRQRQRVARYLNGRWYNGVTGGLFIGMAALQIIYQFLQ